jgi:hypothetical protein
MKTEGPWKCRSDGQRGKPKPGFPRCPQPLEITQDVISTFPPSRLGVEKWKTKSRFPTFPLVVLYLFQNQTKKGGLAADRFAPAFRLILGLENAPLLSNCPRNGNESQKWALRRNSGDAPRLLSLG